MRSFALLLALFVGSATAFTPVRTSAARGAPLAVSPVNEADRQAFSYGTGDRSLAPLGGAKGISQRGEPERKPIDRSAINEYVAQQTPQWDFRYGNGDRSLKP